MSIKKSAKGPDAYKRHGPFAIGVDAWHELSRGIPISRVALVNKKFCSYNRTIPGTETTRKSRR